MASPFASVYFRPRYCLGALSISLLLSLLLALRYSQVGVRLDGFFSEAGQSKKGPLSGFTTSDGSFLHVIIPATSSNKYLCRLQLSLTALGYPTPTLVNWGAEEFQDRYVTHLAKVGGLLEYIKTLEDRKQDLALIIDGFDVLFQLGPDVLIRRYYHAIQSANQRLADSIGSKPMREYNIYNSVIFGPDKICWPDEADRPACWAVPESPLPAYAFGPQTDSGRRKELYRPRWLNSGTIMGPIGDIRAVLQATLTEIQEVKTDIVSDQYHFANVWGQQEYNRLLLSGDPTLLEQKLESSGGRRLPSPANESLELHITIDYESKLFQPVTFYTKYLSWVNYSTTEASGSPLQKLPDDLDDSLPPLARLKDSGKPLRSGMSGTRDPYPYGLRFPQSSLAWNDTMLLMNSVTGSIPAVVHFTPPKAWRDRWWDKFWYYPFAEAIAGASPVPDSNYIAETPDGKMWWNYMGEELIDGGPEARLGSAITDSGDWLSWRRLCGDHLQSVFYNYA